MESAFPSPPAGGLFRAKCGRGADILVFHADCGKPEEEALRLFADFFARNPEAVLAYGDEDEVLPENGGRRTNPWLKPDWSPDTLISYFYFGNIFAVRAAAAGAFLAGGCGLARKSV